MGADKKMNTLHLRPAFLEGKDIFLAPLSKKIDLDSYAAWLNDQETTRYMASGRFPVTVSSLKKYIDSHDGKDDGMLLGIFVKKTKKHVGNIALSAIDWRNRHAEVGIIIGDKKSRGKGYGSQAIMLIAAHAFDKLNMHKLYAGVIEGNEASRKAFMRSGFKEEALLKEHFYLNGEYMSCHRMGFLGRNPEY